MELKLNNGDGSISASDDVFGIELKQDLVHQVVTSYLAGARQGTKAQKNRSQVSGGGKKPWRQKGTGRARAGSTRSPLWVGGGIHFAAAPRSFDKKVNRKMYRGAVKSILSELVRQERLVVAEIKGLEKPSTKGLLESVGFEAGVKTLLVTADEDKNIELSARNANGIAVSSVKSLNPVSLVEAEKVLVTEDAVRKIEGWLA